MRDRKARAVVVIADDAAVTGLLKRVFDVRDDACAEHVLEIGDQHANRHGTAGFQSTGDLVDMKAQFTDCARDDFAVLFQDVAAVDELGDGRDRESGVPRDVFDGCGNSGYLYKQAGAGPGPLVEPGPSNAGSRRLRSRPIRPRDHSSPSPLATGRLAP